MTAVAFISCLISSVFHRPFSKSWWLPFQEMIDSVSCKKSSLLYLCDLFQLSPDGKYWSCKKSMLNNLKNVYSKQLAKRIDDHNESYNVSSDSVDIDISSSGGSPNLTPLPASMYIYTIPPMPCPSHQLHSFNFDTVKLFPSLKPSTVHHYYMDICQAYFYGYGLTDSCAEAFSNLLLKELVDKFTNWPKYLCEPQHLDHFALNGHNFFRKKEHLALLLKVTI